MKPRIKVAFASCSEDLIPTLLDSFHAIAPDLPLYVVSEFRAERGNWIPFRLGRSFADNLEQIEAAFADKEVVLAAIVSQPRMPYWRMRFIAIYLWPWRTVVFNEAFGHFMFRPRSAPTILRHLLWRLKNLVRWELRPGGATYTFLWRLVHPWAYLRPIADLAARLTWRVRQQGEPRRAMSGVTATPPISVVIPSRNGRDLLARLFPSLLPQLGGAAEVIVADNGSDDATAAWLAQNHPSVIVVESAVPLSFAAAVNRGIARATGVRVCLLNNDMVLEPGFFPPLAAAFDAVPDLFAATAQILFPEGVRREETGKAIMRRAPRDRKSADFPVWCDPPIDGENHTYVLYGSGGCTLYDAAKLRALGGFDEGYAPAYVEDLDLGYRAWRRGWPTVFAAPAKVLHLHRSTTSKYYTPAELDFVLERNYLRFLCAATGPAVFRRLWREAIARLNLLAARQNAQPAHVGAQRIAWRMPLDVIADAGGDGGEESFLALTSGDVAVFPGRPPHARPVVLIVSPYAPFPLSHGGAVRMYNLMRAAAADYDLVLLQFTAAHETPPPETLAICAEVVQVRKHSSHLLPLTDRPDVVEEHCSAAMSAAIRMMTRKWRPAIAQLEFTQMAQYARDCAPAKTILVEHDVTLDLYAQLLKDREDLEVRRQYDRWVRFERQAWRDVDCVVTMSERDRRMIEGGRSAAILNGVDLARFEPSETEPEANRLLFIGSFGHLPNVMAVAFFLQEAWPRLGGSAKLHIIAGSRRQYFLDHYKDRVPLDLAQPGIEVEDFVSDVRPAYRRAAIVIAPLVASAGTNIKIMEAMAMGKAIVSTPAGVNGLDVDASSGVIVTPTGAAMADAIAALIAAPQWRRELERLARQAAERAYSWDRIAETQRALYEDLIHGE